MTLRLALLAVLALGGCATGALDAGAERTGVDPVLGQTILFVGTDTATLQTNLYEVQAVDLLAADAQASGGGPGNVLDASTFEVTPLTSFETDPSSPYQNDGDEVLPQDAPFPVPDRLGLRVAVLAQGADPSSGAAVGRVAVLELATGARTLSPDVPDLLSARWTWAGGHLLLTSGTPGAPLSVLPYPFTGEAPTPLPLPGTVSATAQRREAEGLYAAVAGADGATRVLRVDLPGGVAEDVVEPFAGAVLSLTVSPGGDRVAATVRLPGAATRGVAVADLLDAAPALALVTPPDADCADHAFAPGGLPGEAATLASLCTSASGRPDVLVWRSGEGSVPPSTDAVTSGPQTAVPDGSMDGLVLRSRLHWDTTGRIVVFGASSADDAFEAAPATLLAVDVEVGRAVPVFDEDDGDPDLAHFSSVATEPVMLVWDRASSGLDDAGGRHPIRLVDADPSGTRRVRGVALGQSLLVRYPLFLGGNALLYP